MRKRIYDVIEYNNDSGKLSRVYDLFMMAVIIASLVPLAFKENHIAFDILDKVCVTVFIVDYILWWITADYKFNKKSVTSFLRYPFSVMAVIDLLSILPSVVVFSSGFRIFRYLRLIKALRVFKLFKHSKNVEIISNVFRRSKGSLIAVCSLAVGYTLLSALVIFNVEPQSFDNYYDAVYWATVSLMTVGYGDIVPVTHVGRAVAIISSFFGVAIVALPAGIITAGFMNELRQGDKEKK